MIIIRSERFTKRLEELKGKVTRLEEHVRAVEWNIEKNPTRYAVPVDKEKKLWIRSFFDPINRQDVKIYFSFNEDSATLHEIRVIPQKE